MSHTPTNDEIRDGRLQALQSRDTEIDRLRFALATVLGDGDHGQNMTWEERCRIGREALNLKPTS
jgi:hypothetical protein